MSPDREPTTTVNQIALEWLRFKGHPAASVTQVVGHGTDWAGSTNEGFHSDFEVDITYLDTDSRRHVLTVEGESLAELWDRVVGRTQ